MPHDPALVDETRGWMRKAEADLRAGEFEMGADPPLWPDVAFHAQQTAEKALKAFLVWHGATFRKTHSIEEIGAQALTIDPTLARVVDDAVPLTEYAWRSRYPAEPEPLRRRGARRPGRRTNGVRGDYRAAPRRGEARIARSHLPFTSAIGGAHGYPVLRIPVPGPLGVRLRR